MPVDKADEGLLIGCMAAVPRAYGGFFKLGDMHLQAALQKGVKVIMSQEKTPTAGTKAPAFSLPNEDGRAVRLADFWGRWVVLYFYPKDDTPGCTTEACEFTGGIKAFDRLSATVLGVSPDSPESHLKFIAKYKLHIALLSDPRHEVMEKYGAWGVKKMYGKETAGVIRSTFLIDPEGRIAYVWPRVTAAGHAEKVREKLAELAR